ncbi:MAG: TonB-dependent receptor [Gammaproteobacteria bacterium]|nr:TonB-dependent receptor [Gammaproteobacteria bacterium]
MKTITQAWPLSCAVLLGHTAVADVDQIVVTGARTPLTINQTGSAITVITRDEIELRQARHVADLLRAVPGFSLSHTGVVGSQTQLRVRGAEANHVLVMIDGVRANDPATGDEFRWEYLATGDIERIEIVRGPQSSLWGSDAVAAVVHIITRKTSVAPGLDGYFENGSNRTSNAGISGAFGTAKWSVNGGVERLSTDGGNIARTGSENDDSDLTTATLAARFDASERLSFDVGLRAVDAYSQFDPVDYETTGLPVDGDVATDSNNFFAHAGASFHTADDRSSQHFNVRLFDSNNRNLVDGAEDSSTASVRLSFVYQADIKFDKNVLSLGVEHERSQYDQAGEIILGDPNQTQEMDVSSFVTEYQGLSHDKLSWIVSARFDSNSEFDDAINGRLSMAYRLTPGTTLRAGAGTGRKNPTFTERFGYFPAQFVGNENLQPEQSVSYEAGVNHNALDDAMQLQVSFFRQNLRNEINGFVFDPETYLSTAENMHGESKRSGVELAANWTLSEQVALGGHYTYTHSSADGLREIRRPRHTGGVSASYRAANERFSAALNADYGGTRSDTFFAPWPALAETVTLGNYWLVDLSVQYQANAYLAVFAKGSNLLDEDYEQVYGYRTAGRAGFVGLRMTFGR